VREEPGVLVIGVPPKSDVGSMQDSLEAGRGTSLAQVGSDRYDLMTHLQLEHERGRIFLSEVLRNLLVTSESLFVELRDLLENDGSLLGPVPLFGPVLVTNSLARTL
jgi:hypothetical protein